MQKNLKNIYLNPDINLDIYSLLYCLKNLNLKKVFNIVYFLIQKFIYYLWKYMYIFQNIYIF